MALRYGLYKIGSDIFLVRCHRSYDLSMLFCRYQEFYESPNRKFRGKSFTLVDFMEWYSLDRRGCFTYPLDWVGFNIPGPVIDACLKAGIKDPTRYDTTMAKIHAKCRSASFISAGASKHYLIGMTGNDLKSLNHEVAHALFFTSEGYRKRALALIKALPKRVRTSLEEWLRKIGYTSQVFKDEIQAYLSTGLTSDAPKTKGVKEAMAPFQKLFANYRPDFTLTPAKKS